MWQGVELLFRNASEFFESGRFKLMKPAFLNEGLYECCRTDVLVCAAGGLNVRGELLELDPKTIADCFEYALMGQVTGTDSCS